MASPLVSIVTPSYNQGRFIRDTIESVLGQDYPHLEYFVIDGASTDETARVVEPYRDRLTWISEPDRGQSHAINKGWRMARGEIIAWLNSDDILCPGAVSAAAEALERHAEAGAVYGDGYLMDEDGSNARPLESPGPFDLWKLTYISAYIFQPATFFRRKVVEEVGYLDEDLHWAMDWDLFIRIGERYPMEYLPRPLAAQRVHHDAKTSSGGWRRFRELVRLMRRHGKQTYPAAYFAYGLETVATTACRAVRRHVPATMPRLRSAAERRIDAITRWLTWHTHARAAGWWYTDGWANPVVRLLLRPRGEEVVLRGTVPPFPRLRGQTLDVFCDDRFVARHALPFGEFEITVPVPAPHPERTVKLELRASRHFVPRREGVNDSDRRPLAYLLSAVDWARTPSGSSRRRRSRSIS